MSKYGDMFHFLGGQPGFALTTVLYAFLTALFLAVVGSWLPLLVMRRASPAEGTDEHDLAQQPRQLSLFEILALALGGGLILTVCLGTASAYVLKQLLPGVLLASLLGMVSTVLLVMRLRRERVSFGLGGWIFAVLTLIPLLLGWWHHVFMAFPVNLPEDRAIVFSDLYRDSGYHVYIAEVVRETGLPLRDLHGSPVQEYSPVTHTGHAVLIGSLADVLQISVYRSSTSLWIVSLVLLAWSAAALLFRAAVPRGFVLVGGLCPLVLGPVTMPVIAVFSQPDLAVNQLKVGAVTAARMYWNLPQALSTAMVAVALVCFDGYCRAPAGSRSRLKWILAATLSIGISGWVKPSLCIFYGPALLITLIVHRASIKELAVTVVTLALAVVIYMLPGWMVTVADHPTWSLHPSIEQTKRVASFLVLACGPALLLSIAPLRNLLSSLTRKSPPQPLTLALVAMGGSLLFALLFREDRFVNLEDFRVFQPNIWWGPSACVVLLLPLLIRDVTQRMMADSKADWFVIVGLILGIVQIASGTLFAAAYPAVIGRAYPLDDQEILGAARRQTSPDTRFLVDPIFFHESFGFSDLAALLGRPTLFGTAYLPEPEQEALKSWVQLFQEPFESDGVGWVDYEAAILSDRDESDAARTALRERGWTSQDLVHEFQLWTRPDDESEP